MGIRPYHLVCADDDGWCEHHAVIAMWMGLELAWKIQITAGRRRGAVMVLFDHLVEPDGEARVWFDWTQLPDGDWAGRKK